MQRDGIPGISNKTLILVPFFQFQDLFRKSTRFIWYWFLKPLIFIHFHCFGPNNYVFQLVPLCLVMFTCESFLCVCADLRANSIIQDLGKRILKKIKHKKVWFYLIFLIPCGVTLDY